MARSSLNGYSSGMGENILTVPEFHGIDQSRGIHGLDICAAAEAKNFISRFGYLRTANGVSTYKAQIPATASQSLAPVRSRLFQAFLADADGTPYTRLVAVSQRGVYAIDPSDANATWTALGTLGGDTFDALCYRNEDSEWFIMTDGNGDLWRWDGGESLVSISVTQGVDESDPPVAVTIQFQQIVLLYERLWGAVFAETPDRIYWSKSFSPTDWEFDYEIEDDGGGFIEIPTFDGSRIRAIIAAFDDILVFKDKSVHALNGTYPGEFSLAQVYGTEGTVAWRTIVYTGSMLYFLTSDGLCRYDGMTVTTLISTGDRRLKDVWADLNHSAIERACMTLYKNVLYLAIPLNDDERNSVVIEYNLIDGAYSLVEIAGVDDFLVYRDGQTETLLMIAANQVYRYDSGTTIYGNPINAMWLSPEIECGSLSSKKQTGRVYFSVDATSLDVTANPRMKVTMLSGTKTREKIIPLKPGTNFIRKRVKIRGRSFRFKIENMDGNPLTINKGLEIHLETDYD